MFPLFIYIPEIRSIHIRHYPYEKNVISLSSWGVFFNFRLLKVYCVLLRLSCNSLGYALDMFFVCVYVCLFLEDQLFSVVVLFSGKWLKIGFQWNQKPKILMKEKKRWMHILQHPHVIFSLEQEAHSTKCTYVRTSSSTSMEAIKNVIYNLIFMTF